MAKQGECVTKWLATSLPCGFWIKSRMTVQGRNDGRPASPLWIADQVRNELAPRSYPAGTQCGVSCPPLWIARNEVVHCPAVPTLWFPAYAGMRVRDAGNELAPR